MTLAIEVKRLTKAYVSKGGKKNRKQQRNRMIAFAKFVDAMGIHYMGQVGRRHVIEYWKAKRSLAPRTLYSHWLAIRDLWELADKTEEVPLPE